MLIRQGRPSKRSQQQGYVLLMALLMLALLVIALATAVPKLSAEIKREREIEMIHRGEQYARAIRRYYKKFGRYPSRIEELENTNNIRFLRKRYKDPMSPDGTWRLLHVGEVRVGQAAGLGNLTPVAQDPGSQSGSSLFGNNQQPTQSPAQPGADGNNNSNFGVATTGTASTGAGSPGFGGQVFGGGPIIGVASQVNKKGVHEFNNKGNYKDWLFIYDPSMESGGLIKGPYNPNAFKGQAGGGIGTPVQGNLPNIPGATGSGGVLGNSPSPSPNPR